MYYYYCLFRITQTDTRYAMAFESIGWIQTKVVGIGHNGFLKILTNHQSLLKCSEQSKSALVEIRDICKLRAHQWNMDFEPVA